MSSTAPPTPILHRIGIAIFGRPIQALLDWQAASWYRTVSDSPKSMPAALENAAFERAEDARRKSYQWAEKVFWQKTGFPRPGWAARGGLDKWNVILPESSVKNMSMDYLKNSLKKSHLLNRLLKSPDAPWDNPDCEADMLSLLSAHARFIAGSGCSACSGGDVLSKIPKSQPHFSIHFRKEVTSLDPEWHLRDEMDKPDYQAVSQHPSWKEKVALAKNSQEVFLEREELDAATSESVTPSRRSRPRL